MRTTLLALILLVPPAQDKGLKTLEWKVAPGHAVEFVFLDRGGKPLPDQKLLLLGSELTPSSNRIAVDSYDQIPLFMLFQLPPEPIKGASGWDVQFFFFTDASDNFEFSPGGSLRPICAKGRYLVKVQKKGDEEIATLNGAFSLVDIRRDVVNGQLRTTVTKIELGTLATTLQFSLSKGMLIKAAWQYRTKAQVREAGRLVDKKIESHPVLEFLEDVDLDAAKLQPAIEASIGRAVDWLKKQQKNGAWTSPPKAGAAGGDTALLTSFVVRALAAAGVKPDDPALRAASRTLRASPSPETFTLCQQILALAAKAPDPDETEALRKFTEELLQRRDPRSGGWPPAAPGKNDLSPAFLTALALESLASVPDAKIPDETLASGLEFFSGSWIEESGRVDLDLEFEKDAATIAPDPSKGVVPCAWPAFVTKGNDLRAGRKGTAFTQVAALRALLLLPGRMKLDDRALKALDLPLRKGLAGLQSRWTLRSVPPIEGSWSAQRLEYLGMLGPTLARAKVDRIGGSDWRLEGATLLLREQGEDGSWFGATDQAVAKTAHALLFLAAARR